MSYHNEENKHFQLNFALITIIIIHMSHLIAFPTTDINHMS